MAARARGVVGAEPAGLVEQLPVGALGRLVGDDAGAAYEKLGRPGQRVGRDAGLARLASRGRRHPPQAQGVVADVAARRRPRRLNQHVGRHRRRGRVLGGLLVAALRLAEEAPGEAGGGEHLGQRERLGPQVGVVGPHQRGAGVVGDAVEVVAPGGELAGQGQRLAERDVGPPIERIDLGRRPGVMTPADRGQLVGLVVDAVGALGGGLLGHAGEPVLADRVEHAVAGALAGRGEQQAVLRQPGEAGLHRRLAVRPGGVGPVRVAGHRRRGLGRERGGEDRHPPQQGLVGRVEQAVAPIDGRAQRLVALVDAGPARQQVEPLAEAPLDAVEAERGQPGGGQLDGEGAAVEAPADLADARPVGRRERGGAGLPRPLEEQRHRVALVPLARERQTGHGEHPLERQHQPGLGGGEHGHARAPPEQSLHEHPDAGDQVLAVVEHEQGLAVGQVGEDVVLARPAGRVGQRQRPAHRRGHERLVGDRYQVDEPHAVAPAVGHRSGHRRGQAGLAHAPGPDAVTSRCASTAATRPATSADRPTNDVRGTGTERGAGGAATSACGTPPSDRTPSRGSPRPALGPNECATRARARRSGTSSLRSREDTWLSTVRTETNRRAAISALVALSATSSSTSASRVGDAGVDQRMSFRHVLQSAGTEASSGVNSVR